MPIPVTCPKCRRRHQAPDNLAGTSAKCPCGSALAIPRPVVFDPNAPTTVMCTCPKCREQLVLAIQLAGMQANCPSCGALMVVPFPKGMARPTTLIDELTENDWNKVLSSGGGKQEEKNPHGNQLAEFAKQIREESADEFTGTPKIVYQLLVLPAILSIVLMVIGVILVIVIEDVRTKVEPWMVPLIVYCSVWFVASIIPMVAGSLIRKGTQAGKTLGYVGAVCNLMLPGIGLVTAIIAIIKLSSPELNSYLELTRARLVRKQAEFKKKKE